MKIIEKNVLTDKVEVKFFGCKMLSYNRKPSFKERVAAVLKDQKMWHQLINLTGGQKLFAAFLIALGVLLIGGIMKWSVHSSVDWSPTYKTSSGARFKPLPSLKQGVVYSQAFTATQNGLSALRLRMATYGRRNSLDINFSLKNVSDKTTIVSKKIPAAEIRDNAFYTVKFPSIRDSKGMSYVIELTGENYASPNDAITIWSGSAVGIPSAVVNGKPMHGTMQLELTYSGSDAASYHSAILHVEMVAWLVIFLLYAVALFCMRCRITVDTWEKYLYPLLFIVGIGVLMIRATSLISVPDLYTEDGYWSGLIMEKGFWHTFLYAKPIYFVSGNILFLGLGLLINKIVFGCNMFFYPIILTFIQFFFYVSTAILPVVLFRDAIGLRYRVLMFASILLMSGSAEGLCSYQIFGKIENIGYLCFFIGFCVFAHLYNNCKRMGLCQLLFWGLCIQFCYMTNPATLVIAFLFLGITVFSKCVMFSKMQFIGEFDKEVSHIHASMTFRLIDCMRCIVRERVLWLSIVFGIMACATVIAIKMLLHNSSEVLHGAKVDNQIAYAQIVEAICRFFYPFIALFYHKLTVVFATIILLLVLLLTCVAVAFHRKNKLFWMLLLFAFIFAGISMYARVPEVVSTANNYIMTHPFRYAYGVSFFIYVLYFMTVEAFFKRNSVLCKLTGLVMVCIICGSCLVVNKNINPYFPFTEQYVSAFFDHKGKYDGNVRVSVPNVDDDRWNINMSLQRFECTRDFLIKHSDGLLIPSVESMFYKENYYWKNCIGKRDAAFYVRNTEENRKKFRKGCKVVLPPPYGERIIEGVREDRIFFDVYLSGSRLATDKVIDFEKCIVNAQK